MRRAAPALVLLLLAVGLAAVAGVDVELPADPALAPRYRALIEEMRCPKCQNQNLADSDAPIAADLRREVRRQLDAGRSDQQIIAAMTARYGDFVRYRPRWQRNTWLLWLAPGILLAAAIAVAVVQIKRQRRRGLVAALTDDEAAALRHLLAQHRASGALDAPEQRR